MVQLQVLNYILNSKDASIITLNNLNADYFSDYSAEYTFISNHLHSYGNVPDIETFMNAFPDFELIVVSETTQCLLEELFKDYQKRLIASTVNKIRTLFMNDKTDEAVAEFKKASEGLSGGVGLQCVDLFRDTSRYDAYIERTQDYSKYYLSTGFRELDSIIGGIDREEELGVIVARTNLGKCLAKGSKVLMADGSLKKVEDITIGDKVQSENAVNTVLALHNGVSNGYRIVPNSGEEFTVSSNHILTILQLKEKWDRERKQTITTGEYELKDISIEDYLKLSAHKKRISRLYFPTVEYNTKSQTIPAYILGLWLGDGTSREPEITTMDSEIRDELYHYAYNEGLAVSVVSSSKGKASTYSITGKNGYFRNLLKEYNLLNNKHIPLDYLTGDKHQRLELLAGLIDTDGYLDKNSNLYEITQKSYKLISQIAQLARGLGFKVNTIRTKHNSKYNKDYYSITLSGNLSVIPSRLVRKKSVVTKDKISVTGFKVEPVEQVEYYGFMADGDHRYIMGNGILTHNTWILLKMAVAAATQGLNVGLYSGEMSERKVGYRVDTLLGHINNGSLTHGNINVQNSYKKYMDDLPKKYTGSLKVLTPKMINGSAGVNALRAFIEKEHLDILFIDQLSLLEDDRKAKVPFERASNISKDLKNLQVMKKIPIISVSQQNRTKNDDKEDDSIDTTQLAMSDRIAQDATFILGITRDKKDNTIMNIHIVKSRDSANGQKITYLVDLGNGQFTFVPEEGDNKSSVSTTNIQIPDNAPVYDNARYEEPLEESFTDLVNEDVF